MRYVLFASLAVGLVLLILLAAATGNTSRFAGYYPVLVVINVAAAVALVVLVVYQFASLAYSLRMRRFGARLSLRLVVLFCLVALLPGALVYTVSVQFLSKSIESWFDVRVDSALEGGLNLGRSMLDNMLEELAAKAGVAALDLAERPPAQQPLALNRIREQTGADEVALISGHNVIASATREAARLVPDTPSAALIRQARANRGHRGIESVGERGLRLRVLVPVASFQLAEEARLLQLIASVPPTLAANAESVQSVYRGYKELQLSRKGLRELYIFALTITLLLTLFTAFALAFILSRRLSEPLARLAEGTEAVARGDFSRRVKVTSADELGTLSASFNSMTEQLDEARRVADRARIQVENAKAHVENVLGNLSTGVLVFDRDMRLAIANSGASRILGEPLESAVGARLAEAAPLAPLAEVLLEGFREAGDEPWQREIELVERGQALVVRGSRLPAAGGEARAARGDYVVVFDDVTALIQAERATAWAEVAQRLAHEIKNPLTPIQLAAERLQMKLAERLPPEDAQALARATGTIITQVGAMKRMVDEFREYARLPAPQLAPTDLNEVIREVLTLYESARGGIVLALAAGLPPVAGDASQLRQVIHNLLLNAQDAVAAHGGSVGAGSAGAPAPIELRTEAHAGGVRFSVTDNGPGFPESLIKRAFEPYVTSKAKGTGLGLAIVKKIVDEHGGTITLANLAREPAADGARGARITITLPGLAGAHAGLRRSA